MLFRSCIVSKDNLLAHQHLAIYLNFLGHDFVLTGVVLNNGIKNDNGMYTNRVKFLAVDDKKSDLLAKLIIEKQRIAMRQTSFPLKKS